MNLHLICALPLLACLVLSAKGAGEEGTGPRSVQPAKELLILDPAVVDSAAADYPGALSIGHLFDELAADGDGARLMRHWLETWLSDQEVNGATVAARPDVGRLLIEPWQRADGWTRGAVEDWRPDLANAPFRLLAVVNRLDLAREAAGGGGFYGADPGEFVEEVRPQGRLVYAAIDAQGKPLGHHFTVIFEYDVPDSMKLVEIAQSWHALGLLEFEDEAFLPDLEVITRGFTDRVWDDELKQNVSNLAQVRTNEMAFSEICELREFKMDEARNILAPAALANTPSMAFARKGSRLNRVLADFIQEHDENAKGTPLVLPGALAGPSGKSIPLLVGSSLVPNKRFHWDSVRITDPETRHHFSIRTCNGCHAGDTNTEFCHISPRLEGEASKISEFLRMDGSSFKILDPAVRRRQVESAEMRDRVSAFLSVLYPSLRERDLERASRRSRTTH